MLAARVVPLAPSAAPVIESAHARLFVLAPGAPLPEGTEVAFSLPDASRVAYAPTGPGRGAARDVAPDPLLAGNAFRALHESARAHAALLSIAAARRVETGPQTERVFVALRGRGLVFLENGDTHRVEPGFAAFVPAGEPARVWAQGPEDLLVVALQPAGVEAAPRRTLASELLRVKAARADDRGASRPRDR